MCLEPRRKPQLCLSDYIKTILRQQVLLGSHPMTVLGHINHNVCSLRPWVGWPFGAFSLVNVIC